MKNYDEHKNDPNKLDKLKFKEEGNEDIDVMYDNKQDLYQLKYHVSEKAKSESITFDCGLIKVLSSNFNNEKISNVYYEYYYLKNEENKDKVTNILYLFEKIQNDSINNFLIGKYIIMSLFNLIKISSKKNQIDNKYLEYIEEIRNHIDIDIKKKYLITLLIFL